MKFFHSKSREQRVIDDIFLRLERDLGGTPYQFPVNAPEWRVVNAQHDMSVATGGFGRPEQRLTVELIRTR